MGTPAARARVPLGGLRICGASAERGVELAVGLAVAVKVKVRVWVADGVDDGAGVSLGAMVKVGVDVREPIIVEDTVGVGVDTFALEPSSSSQADIATENPRAQTREMSLRV
jgi:hypothetical protein